MSWTRIMRLCASHSAKTLTNRAIISKTSSLPYQYFRSFANGSTNRSHFTNTPFETSTQRRLDDTYDHKNGEQKQDERTDSDKQHTTWSFIWDKILLFNSKLQSIKEVIVLSLAAFGLWKFEHHSRESKVQEISNSFETGRIHAQSRQIDNLRQNYFTMQVPKTPHRNLKRPSQEYQWKRFIYSCLLGNSLICWIYGAKRVGKSTMLKKFTYELQLEMDHGLVSNLKQYKWANEIGLKNFRIFYVNLEQMLKAGTGHTAEIFISQLCDEIESNNKKGLMSLVVVDSIGPIFANADLREDMNFEEFKSAVEKVDFIPDWAVSFFRFVKATYDDNGASFIFVTSKPYHHVLKLPKINHSLFGSAIEVDIDSSTQKRLSLFLSEIEIKSYLKSIVPWLDDQTVTQLKQELAQMETEKCRMNRIGHLKSMIRELEGTDAWEEKFAKKKEIKK